MNPSDPSAAGKSSARGELRRVLALMLPLYLANLMNIGMGVIDTIVAGQAGTADLAAVALGCSVTAPVMVSIGAILNILSPMLARLLGARMKSRAGLLLHNGLALSPFLMVAEVVLLWAGSLVFPLVTTDERLAAAAQLYVYFVMAAVPASLVMRVVQGCWEGHGQTRPAMVVCLIGLALNIPLNYACVLGWWGFPAMGGPGCGLATAIVHWLMAVVLLGMLFFSSHRHEVRHMFALRLPNLGLMHRVLRLGSPLGVASFCEMSYFCVISLVIAPLGELMVSAQQIAINVSGVFFMFPLSLGVAVSIRAAYHVGAHDPSSFRAMLRGVLLFMYAAVLLLVCLSIPIRFSIVALYTSDPIVSATAAHLIILCALYQFSDSTQALMAGLLRGCHDTAVLSWANIVSYWLLGLPLSLIWIHTDWFCPRMGPAGAWWSFIVSLTVVAIILLIRFRHTSRRIFGST